MKFSAWLKDLFEDERQHTSIKPVIALIGALTLCTMMVINAVLKSAFNPSTALVDAVMIITSIGMGADSLDKFSFKGRAGDGYSSSESYSHSESSDNATDKTKTTTKRETSSTSSDPNIGESSNELL